MFKSKKKNGSNVESSCCGSGHVAQEGEVRDVDISKLDEEGSENGSGGGSGSDEENHGEESSNLKKELDRLKLEVSENQDKYLRALADFENYKKRTLKERSDMMKYQGEKVLFDILEVMDNLDLALQHADADPEKLRSGVELIQKMLVGILGRWEVRGESGIGKEFDPSKHAAISKIVVDDAKPGTIINELKKTYFYKDKLLRPGEVVVAEPKTDDSTS